PRGLRGPSIPIEARIVAVARDSCRLVDQEKDVPKALSTLTQRAGSDYDPEVVSAFCRALRHTEYVSRLHAPRGGASVLVADGDPAALAVAELKLSAAGFDVRAASDGKAALEAIAADPPDALVADVSLPRFDGITLLLKMRRERRTEKMPVFLTGETT